jgi:hypothetical protein
MFEELHVHVELGPLGKRCIAHDTINVAIAVDLDLRDVHILNLLHELWIVDLAHDVVVPLTKFLAFVPGLDDGQSLGGSLHANGDDPVQNAHVNLLVLFCFRDTTLSIEGMDMCNRSPMLMTSVGLMTIAFLEVDLTGSSCRHNVTPAAVLCPLVANVGTGGGLYY